MTPFARLLPLAAAVLAPLALVAVQPAPPPATAAPLARADSTEWVNLQVLPDSLSRDELTAIMRRFTEALGVQCGYCHVRTDGAMDFPSDDKGHKRIARGMIVMTQQLNRETLPAVEGLGGHGTPAVSCWTCHRGQTRPALTPADSAGHSHH